MTDHGSDWRPMESAPRDGSRILVAVHESEQGPAEVDLVRWTTPPNAVEKDWVATDSQPGSPVTYPEGELAGWMPLPTPPDRPAGRRGEVDGSSI